VYKRYASLFFCFAIDRSDNELIALEIIHRYVEVLDQYFGSVCELVRTFLLLFLILFSYFLLPSG
jgi:hypothetical protein